MLLGAIHVMLNDAPPRDAPNLRGQAAQESSTAAGEGPPIRGLYQTKRGGGEDRASEARGLS